MLSGRGLCDGLITHPEESYRLWCVVVCDLENLVNEEALPHWGAVAPKRKKSIEGIQDTSIPRTVKNFAAPAERNLPYLSDSPRASGISGSDVIQESLTK